MPSASPMMKPSFSLNTTSKLGYAINSASIISFEKRSDQKIWYIIKVEPYKKRPFLIARRYEDFTQLSQKLHERFNTTKQRAGSRLPPKIKSRLNLLPASKQLHAQRAEELEQFLSILFCKQTMITESFFVLDFFSIQKSDSVLEQEEEEQENAPSTTTSSSRWKRLRCTSFLARSPPTTTTSTSNSSTSGGGGLSSLCSQAANKIWHRSNHGNQQQQQQQPQPSMSTPTSTTLTSKNATGTVRSFQLHSNTHVYHKGELKKSKSSHCIREPSPPPTPLSPLSPQHPLSESTNSSRSGSIASSHLSTSTCATIISPSPSTSNHLPLKPTIKIKVIYDVDNIIVLQVPRSIALHDLRSRIAQKFSDPSMGSNVHVQDEVVLLFNDSNSSCCSIATAKNDMALPAVLINKEQDLVQIMHTKWNRLEKVTLRCIM
ncbi:hypothetical protein MAM1_0003c00362 [Mucor ambiguus]|uniref:PX domain-containing protein n=1 Tax=Mucor ambiguus TaxID=91626 RepID=A0A0C9M404_9FUNG|nr:hypothetical protein MAM1_0003c00362 [Mucor ambiguus]